MGGKRKKKERKKKAAPHTGALIGPSLWGVPGRVLDYPDFLVLPHAARALTHPRPSPSLFLPRRFSSSLFLLLFLFLFLFLIHPSPSGHTVFPSPLPPYFSPTGTPDHGSSFSSPQGVSPLPDLILWACGIKSGIEGNRSAIAVINLISFKRQAGPFFPLTISREKKREKIH